MIKILALILIAYSLLLPAGLARAQECDGEPPTDITQLNDYIANCKAKINESQAQQKTLAATIGYLNSQINLTSGQIAKTAAELTLLEVEIGELSGKIESLDYSLDDLTKLFISRVQDSYIEQFTSDPFLSVFNSQGFADFFRRYQYVQRVRDHDREVMIALETARLDFDQQKSLKEKKQAEVTALRKQLEVQQASLADQKSAKDALLAQTKNNEAQYQNLLSQALAEKAAIEKALVSGVKVGPVKRGDPIALVGNSGYPGCSTGKHLHFEIRQGGTWVNPTSFLEAKNIYDDDLGTEVSVGTGSWPWPIESPIRMTQHFGQTPYSWRYTYSGGVHTGFDMVSSSSDVIRAPADGVLFESSQGCGGSIINIVYIEHEGGVISLFLHVQ